METKPVERPSDLTASWLTTAIGAGEVADFETERIGTGRMSECYRVRLTYSEAGTGPESVVLKVAASDPVSRQTGLALGLYEREVRFYGDIAPRLGGPIAPCYHAAIDTSTGVFDLLLGDAVPAVVGNEIAGATVEQATIGVVDLERLHGPLLGDASLAEAPWLNCDSLLNQAMVAPLYAGFLDRYGDQIAPAHRMVCERLVGAFDAYLAAETERNQIRGLVHGDYRLDNMLFGTDGADRPLTVVDWQTVSWGRAVHRPGLLSRLRTVDGGPPGTLRHVAAGLSRGARSAGADHLRRCHRRCSPPKLFRCVDGDRVLDAGGTHRARRPAVHDDAATALRSCARYRRAGHAAQRGGAGTAAANRRR